MNDVIPTAIYNNPRKYYFWLRQKRDLSPRSAINCVLGRFCKDSQDYHRRLESITRCRKYEAVINPAIDENEQAAIDGLIHALKVFIDKYNSAPDGKLGVGLVNGDFFRAEMAITAYNRAIRDAKGE